MLLQLPLDHPAACCLIIEFVIVCSHSQYSTLAARTTEPPNRLAHQEIPATHPYLLKDTSQCETRSLTPMASQARITGIRLVLVAAASSSPVPVGVI